MWIGLTKKKKKNKANLITLQPTNNYVTGTRFRVFRHCKKNPLQIKDREQKFPRNTKDN